MADETALNEKFLDRCKWLFGKRELTAEDMAMIQYMKDDLGFHNEDAIWGVIKVFANGRQDMERNVAAMERSVSEIRPALADALAEYKDKGGVINLVRTDDKIVTMLGLTVMFIVQFVLCVGCYLAGANMNEFSAEWLVQMQARTMYGLMMSTPAGWIASGLASIVGIVALVNFYERIYYADRGDRKNKLKKHAPHIGIAVSLMVFGVYTLFVSII